MVNNIESVVNRIVGRYLEKQYSRHALYKVYEMPSNQFIEKLGQALNYVEMSEQVHHGLTTSADSFSDLCEAIIGIKSSALKKV